MIFGKGNKHFAQVLMVAPVLFMFHSFSYAQKNFIIRHFDESHGLSSDFTEAITQGNTGHLIIATKGGIDRFDGKTFENVKADGDTSDLGYITSMFRTDEEVWFGKFNGDIGVMSDGISNIKTGINGQIKHIYKDQRDGVWAFSRSGMVFWANGSDTSRFDMSEHDMLLNAVIPYKHKEFIIGSNDGLWLIRFEVGNDFQVLRHVEGLPETKITALRYESGKDQLWVGTEDAGLYIVSAPFTQHQQIREFKLESGRSIDDVQSIYTDHLNRVWLGTFGEGIIRIEFYGDGNTDFTTHEFSDEIDEEYLVHDIFEDREQNVWIATFGGGLIQVVENVFHHPFDANWLKQQSITQLYRDSKDNIWLGIDRGLFKTSEHSSQKRYEYFYVGGNTVTAIGETPDGKIWLGTATSGLYRHTPGAKSFSHLEGINENLANSINNILATDEKVYVSTMAGLLIYSMDGRLRSKLTTLDGLPHNNVNYCYRDSKGRIWIACQGNRICYLWKGEIRFIETASEQTITDVNYLLEDTSGRLWFATMGQGLAVLDNGKVTNLNSKNELPSDYCYQMVLDDDQHVWVSHQKSITQISPDLKQNRLVTQEELTDSENSMVSFLFKDDEGSIWISSTHNVVKFNPAIDKSSKSKPPLSIAAMLVDGKPQPMVPNFTLTYKKYDIVFRLAGISLRDPNAISYRYQLKGQSDSWTEQNDPEVRFAGLSYGSYELKVFASKNGGPWTDEPVTYRFSIAKPWWLQPWSWVLMIIGLLAGMFGFVRYRTFRLVKDKAILEDIVQERTEEIQDQKAEIERSRDEIAKYAKDITDSIKYAKRIQRAIFPAWKDVQYVLPEVVVFYRSKDLVSGDFYFAEKVGSKRLFAAVDCTGHGVPGGFMSIVGNNLLQQAIKQVGLTKPSDILDYTSHGITNTLHQTYEESSVKDGMDVALCCWNEDTSTVEYAGAYNPLYLFRDGKLQEFKGDRFPVGTFVGEEVRAFTNHYIKVRPGDMLYIFSDGFADQFGGPDGKKFMMSRFRTLLTQIHSKPMNEQHDILEKTFMNWKGNLEQVDDICVLGVRIP